MWVGAAAEAHRLSFDVGRDRSRAEPDQGRLHESPDHLLPHRTELRVLHRERLPDLTQPIPQRPFVGLASANV